MKANELTAGQVFTTADKVKIVARDREVSGDSAGDLRFRAIEGEIVLAELCHMPGVKVTLPANSKVSRK